jgi:DNA-binding IclR family transcriptional regulator
MSTVSKALDLLDVFTRTRADIGLSDLARLAGVNKATCYRLMSDLAAHGFVEQTDAARSYRLGPAFLRYAALREAAVPMKEAALPLLTALAKESGETVHVSALVAGDLRTIAYAYSPAHAMKVMMEDADHLPFHATSSGLAVLAHMAPNARSAVLGSPLARRTVDTLTDPARLKERLALIRAQGIAESAGGYEPEVSSLAVPLFDALGRVSGALAVAAPAARLDDPHRARIRAGLCAAAPDMVRLWGGSAPQDITTLWAATAQGRDTR